MLANLSILYPPFLLGMLAGGSVIYWFTAASTQAVTTGAYHAVKFIKSNIKLEGAEKASTADSKKVVEICTKFAILVEYTRDSTVSYEFLQNYICSCS